MVLAWRSYLSDLGRAYPMLALSVVQVNDVPTDINPLDLLPTAIISQTIETVFSNNLNRDTGSLTSRFTNAAAFYIDAPLLNVELEINVFLQVYFPTATSERVRNLALGKLKDGQIKLNETDTETVVSIPSEFIDSGLEMALFFLSSDTTFLEVYVLGKDCTLCGVKSDVSALSARLNDIESKIDELATVNSNNNSNFYTILNLILTAVGVPTPTPLPVAATADEQAFFFLQ